MKSLSEIKNILITWHSYVFAHNNDILKLSEIWLLQDFVYQNYSEIFYKNRAKTAINILDKLDHSKQSVIDVDDYLRPIIRKYVDNVVQEELF